MLEATLEKSEQAVAAVQRTVEQAETERAEHVNALAYAKDEAEVAIESEQVAVDGKEMAALRLEETQVAASLAQYEFVAAQAAAQEAAFLEQAEEQRLIVQNALA